MANLKDTIVLGNLTVTGTVTASDLLGVNKFLPLAGGNMTGAGPIQYPTDNGDNKSNYYISSGAGYSVRSGKYGVKLLACDQSDCQSGMGQDCGNGSTYSGTTNFSYDTWVIGGKQPGGNLGYISFGFHTKDTADYKRVGHFDYNGNLTLNYGSLYFNNTNYAGVGIGTVPTQFAKEHGPAASSNYPIWIASAGDSNQIEGAGIMIDGQTIQMWAPMDAHPSFMDSDTGITWNIALGAGNLCFIKACTAGEYANLSSKDNNTLYFIK